jgi:hypothetical protein
MVTNITIDFTYTVVTCIAAVAFDIMDAKVTSVYWFFFLRKSTRSVSLCRYFLS